MKVGPEWEKVFKRYTIDASTGDVLDCWVIDHNDRKTMEARKYAAIPQAPRDIITKLYYYADARRPQSVNGKNSRGLTIVSLLIRMKWRISGSPPGLLTRNTSRNSVNPRNHLWSFMGG